MLQEAAGHAKQGIIRASADLSSGCCLAWCNTWSLVSSELQLIRMLELQDGIPQRLVLLCSSPHHKKRNASIPVIILIWCVLDVVVDVRRYAWRHKPLRLDMFVNITSSLQLHVSSVPLRNGHTIGLTEP